MPFHSLVCRGPCCKRPCCKPTSGRERLDGMLRWCTEALHAKPFPAAKRWRKPISCRGPYVVALRLVFSPWWHFPSKQRMDRGQSLRWIRSLIRKPGHLEKSTVEMVSALELVTSGLLSCLCRFAWPLAGWMISSTSYIFLVKVVVTNAHVGCAQGLIAGGALAAWVCSTPSLKWRRARIPKCKRPSSRVSQAGALTQLILA